MAQTVARHSGWKNFFVHLSFPLENKKPAEETENDLQKLVMGAGYDAITSGKNARRTISNGWGWDE